MKRDYEITSLDYYSVPLECLNCKSIFLDDSDKYKRDFISNPYVSNQIMRIKMGCKISEVDCPVCGCQTLIRYRGNL